MKRGRCIGTVKNERTPILQKQILKQNVPDLYLYMKH